MHVRKPPLSVLLPPRTHVRVKETWGEKMSEAEAQGIQQAEGIGYSEGEQVADQQETPQDGQVRDTSARGRVSTSKASLNYRRPEKSTWRWVR